MPVQVPVGQLPLHVRGLGQADPCSRRGRVPP
jgi:hypothetical protein